MKPLVMLRDLPPQAPPEDLEPLVARIAEYWRQRRDEMLVEWTLAALRGDDVEPHAEAPCPAR